MQYMRETLNNLRKESETTIRMLYMLKKFRHFLTESKENLILVNQNADFWNIFESSIRTNLFVGIRRIYENKADTFNFQKFIAKCIDNIDDFSKENLKKRKLESSANAIDWIDQYMISTYEPTISDFKKLSGVVKSCSKRMKGIYTDAASKIFIHAIHLDRSSINQITDQLSFNEIEVALDSVWHCYNQIWHMYENGHKPEFEVVEYPYKSEISECFIKQIRLAYA